MKSKTCLMVAVCVLLGAGALVAEVPTLEDDATPRGTTHLVYELYGGTWHDAEKDYADGGYEDGYMCWAAVASNMLTWGGWGEGGEFADEDAVFDHFQVHWISAGGDPLFAVTWWFSGHDKGYPQRDVPGGGGFYPELNSRDFMRGPYLGHRGVLDRIRSNTLDGYVSGIRVTHPTVNFSHSVTCWGVNVDPETDEVIGLWITDSDDDPNGAPPRENYLRYYEVAVIGGKTYVQGYVKGEGTKAYIIDEVLGLSANPAASGMLPAAQVQQVEPSVQPEPSGQLALVEPAQADQPLTPRVIAGFALIVLGAGVVIWLVCARAKAARS